MTDPRDEIIRRLAMENVRLKAKVKDLEGYAYDPQVYTSTMGSAFVTSYPSAYYNSKSVLVQRYGFPDQTIWRT